MHSKSLPCFPVRPHFHHGVSFLKASRTAVMEEEINTCDKGHEGAEPCLDIGTEN